MRALQVLQAANQRLRPSRWGALPLFLGLLVALRFSLGPPGLLLTPRLGLVLLPLLAGYYLLAPMPWQWTGDDRGRAALWPGALQALAWNALWLLAVAHLVAALVHSGTPNALPHPASPIPLHRLPPWAALMVLNLPVAFLAGWFVAEKEGADQERLQAERARLVSETAARAAQVRALQAQLDPHVLYNALGGLAELVRAQPAVAEEALLDLADLYRLLTALGQQRRIPLRAERDLLERTLALERLRLGERLRVEWDWPADLGDLEVPPLCIQPLVENALKHGISPAESGGILRLSARREAQQLLVRVANTGAPLAPADGGTGLGNLRARLDLLEGKGWVELQTRDEWTVAELHLPLEPHP